MKNVISASRRTDLIAHFPQWLSEVLTEKKALVYGPSRHSYAVDLSPDVVHTIVLWSKNFNNLIKNRFSLKTLIQKYDQIYLHFTITGLGGTFIERGVPSSNEALDQLESLIKIAGSPERLTIRFDPIVYWNEAGELQTNLNYFAGLIPELSYRAISKVRFSFAQWYGKAQRRAVKYGFSFVDPAVSSKLESANYLAGLARENEIDIYACSQSFLSDVSGIQTSSCINGTLLRELHPKKLPVSIRKDKSQRRDCRCTDSIDIGSYIQSCPHSCLYCYANPKF